MNTCAPGWAVGISPRARIDSRAAQTRAPAALYMTSWLRVAMRDARRRSRHESSSHRTHCRIVSHSLPGCASGRARGRYISPRRPITRSRSRSRATLNASTGVIATQSVNLSSHNKADALSERFGERQCDYAGNSVANVAVAPRTSRNPGRRFAAACVKTVRVQSTRPSRSSAQKIDATVREVRRSSNFVGQRISVSSYSDRAQLYA
jgi:hypothetical protein